MLFQRLLPLLALYAIAVFAISGCSPNDQVVWQLDNLESIGGHKVTLEGSPKVIETPNGKAIEFDGIDDALFLDVHPLEGLSTFTVEVIFKPYKNGAAEQRFFHMQENASDSRVMFETRLVENDLWFLDTFIKSGNQSIALYAKNNKHNIDGWQHAAIVVDQNSFKHFVNGTLELNEEFQYTALKAGRTSLGVRINKVNWFKGAIRTIRFTPRPLAPEEFLRAED